MSLIEYSQLDTSPLRYQVDRMIPEVGTGFLWGQSWAGKSLLGIDMGLGIGNGTRFLGHETIKGTVAYLVGEGLTGIGVRTKARILRQQRDDTARIAEIARTQDDEAARTFAANLPAYTGDNFKIKTEPFPMHFDRANKPLPALSQAMAELSVLNTPGPDDDPETWPYLSLVIMDALANFAGQLSISSDASANRITQTMQWMSRELDCCVLAIAHPTAKGDKMLGAERLFNSADFVIHVEPDDVQAPGALKTATISCAKSKDDNGFEPFGYQIEPCKWDEPMLDDDGQPTGETEEVTSATVTLTAATARSAPPSRAEARPMPELTDNRPRPRKRNGIRPSPSPVVAHNPPKSAAVTPGLTAALLAARCAECGRPGGMGCDVTMPGSGLVPVSLDPVLAVHAGRVMYAATRPGSALDLDQVQAWLAGLPKKDPAPEPAPERDRLWWTTVRPGKTGARA